MWTGCGGGAGVTVLAGAGGPGDLAAPSLWSECNPCCVTGFLSFLWTLSLKEGDIYFVSLNQVSFKALHI